MSDIKLFRLDGPVVRELQGQAGGSGEDAASTDGTASRNIPRGSFPSERVFDREVPRRASIDENNSPVIIEYKRSTNENVINQGLFYLDWLHDAYTSLSAQFAADALNAEWPQPLAFRDSTNTAIPFSYRGKLVFMVRIPAGTLVSATGPAKPYRFIQRSRRRGTVTGLRR